MKNCQYFKLLLILSFLFLVGSNPAPTGIHYQHFSLAGPLSIHMLEVDPNLYTIKSVHAGNYIIDTEKTSSMAKRHQAIAAVNGGFFQLKGIYPGAPAGILKIDKQFLGFNQHHHAAIGWRDDGKKTILDRVAVFAYLQANKQLYPIHGLNQPRQANKAILYSAALNNHTLTHAPGLELTINKKFLVTEINSQNNSIISHDGWVYSIGNKLALKNIANLKGQTVKFLLFLKPINQPQAFQQWHAMDNIVNGIPLLMNQGKLIDDFSFEKLPKSFSHMKHPRTAVCIKPNGHWLFVVVDGRNQLHSIGMTIKELAKFMQAQGCEDAINLDGGGSTTMYYQGRVVNTPSGYDTDTPNIQLATEREVGDAILILPKLNRR